jgi:membrane protein implicated in regulation of membrane protease activity
METLQALFGASSVSETIYWTIAVSTSGLLGIKAILALVGLDLDVDLDVDLGGDDITLSALFTFLGLGSWAGVFLKQGTALSETGVLLSALVSGTVGFAAMVFFINRLKKLETSGNVEIANAIGKTADVYLGIPGARAGEGQVQILVQGRLMIFDALTEGKEIITGQKVLVYDVEDNKLMVDLYENKEPTI